ncbi:unnamed protein product [Arctia plantaginis]|uniref:Heparanase n=1 Tax=Arctia plantaginis TaxID=874455 RepID=A0A8S1BI17_ARCPL|nr:unnamed protein product [Arctia plantaginis]
MGTVLHFCMIICLCAVRLVSANTYSVSLLTEQHVNLVDSKFLSFTIDPKYLFSTSEKYNSKECVCMASSLTPAYIRIAGPSTSHMSFHNTTISINEIDFDLSANDLEVEVLDADTPKKVPIEMKTVNLAVTHRQWRKFIHWAKSTGFDLVFALNNEERTASGMWDPNTALNILTVAEKAKVGDIFWELGYECKNQSIEEYLNDLETLSVITETFPPGRMGEWKVVGGDVSKCLQADSKSDFKDYVVLSIDMMDALLLNGNSSYKEMERMTKLNRLKLLRHLANSRTPLWLTERNQRNYNQLERAADWLGSLGYAAKNGFSVHFRELEEEEIYEPTLSFYMALLFKNLVGERVLNVEMVPEQAILFGHCTSLRHKRVPGAVTLFGVNLDDEPARFSLKLPKREDGGDIMQFILGHDHSGNIVVNGRAMYYEGDIKPVVKRVRPFKTLLITLPAKSFGFWVLANTKIEACQDIDNSNNTNSDEQSVTESVREKRSVDDDFEDYNHIANPFYDYDDTETSSIDNKALIKRIADINRDLGKIQSSFHNSKGRFKRDEKRAKFRPLNDRNNFDLDPKGLLSNILQKAKQSVEVLKNKGFKEVKRRLNRNNRVSKRHSKHFRVKTLKTPMRYFDTQKHERFSKKRTNMRKIPKHVTSMSKKNLEHFNDDVSKSNLKNNQRIQEDSEKLNVIADYSGKHSIENEIAKDIDILESKNRRRRHIDKDVEELSFENDIDFEEKKKRKAKLWQILKKIQEEVKDFSQETTDEELTDSPEGIVLKTELSDDSATIKVEDTGKGLLQSTMRNMVNVLEDLNKNFNRFWDALSMLG